MLRRFLHICQDQYAPRGSAHRKGNEQVDTPPHTHTSSTKQTRRDAGSVEMISNDLKTLVLHFLKRLELFVFQLKERKKKSREY